MRNLKFKAGFDWITLLFVLLITHLLLPQKALAQVVINEFSSWEGLGDWVELYAFEDTDISGWIIRDSASSIVETIPTGISIGPTGQSYYVAEVGNRLNKDGDIIKLYKPDDSTQVDQISYGDKGGVCAPGVSQTVGRYPDANNVVERFDVSSTNTKGSSNTSAQLAPCPTPTPTSTPQPTPTFTPTPTPVPTSTPTLTPTIKPTVVPTKIPTTTPEVLAVVTSEPLKFEMDPDNQDIRSANGQTEVQGSEVKSRNINYNSPILPGILIIFGATLIGFAFFRIIKENRKEHNIQDVE